jgi:hypothetical protein
VKPALPIVFLGALAVAGIVCGVVADAPWTRAAHFDHLASPGALTPAHAFLESNCAACHTSFRGVDAPKCIVCHANDLKILQRQPTAFHANIQDCRECHLEHLGLERLTGMQHEKLVDIALSEKKSKSANFASGGAGIEDLRSLLSSYHRSVDPVLNNPHLSSKEAILDCAACHDTKDRHFGLFGNDCALCHSTDKWTIAEFRHPPPTSTSCAQCHQAPPCHYIEQHFAMISERIARQPNTPVDQCYKCHQTTAWNDIQGFGCCKLH